MTETRLNPEMVTWAKSLIDKDDIRYIAQKHGIAPSSVRDVRDGKRRGSCELIDTIQRMCKSKHDIAGKVIARNIKESEC